MATKEMYDLAFAFKKSKAWEIIFEDEIFAVKLDGDRIGYCCVMGRDGEHIALSLYVGDEGFSSYLDLLLIDPEQIEDCQIGDIMLQDCVQCALENRDDLSPEEVEAVRAYAKERGLALRGAHSFPMFTRYRTYYHPWFVDDPTDQRDIMCALEATVALVKYLKDYDKDQIGLKPLYYENQKIPMLVKDKGRFVINYTETPAPTEKTFAEPDMVNEVQIAKLKKQKQAGTVEAEIVRMPSAVRESEDDIPYFPANCMLINKSSGLMLRPAYAENAEYDPNEMLQSVLEVFVNAGVYPKRIEVRTEETETVLRPLCEKAGIKLTVVEELPQMDELFDSLEDDYEEIMDGDIDPDGLMGALDGALSELASMTDEDLRQMPPELADQLLALANNGMMPENLAKRIKRLFR